MKNKWAIKITSFLFGIFLAVFTLLCGFGTFVLGEKFYIDYSVKIGLADELQMSQADLNDVYTLLLRYCRQGDITLLNGQHYQRGVMYNDFNDADKGHMVDVRNLIFFAQIMYVLSIIYLFSFIVSMLLRKKLDGLTIICKLILKTYLVVVSIFALLLLVMIIDFNWIFEVFHKIFFFGKDDWMMGYDDMVKYLPQDLFMTAAIMGFVIAALVAILLTIVATYVVNLTRVKKSQRTA